MKAKFIGKSPLRTADKKYIPGQEYELSKHELDSLPGKFELIQDKPKPKTTEKPEV